MGGKMCKVNPVPKRHVMPACRGVEENSHAVST